MPHKSQLKRCVMLRPQILALFICFFFCSRNLCHCRATPFLVFPSVFLVFSPCNWSRSSGTGLIFTKTPILCTLTLNLHIHPGSWWILLFFYGPITDGDFTLKILTLGQLQNQRLGDCIFKMPEITPSAHNCNGRNEFTLSRQFAGNYYPICSAEKTAKIIMKFHKLLRILHSSKMSNSQNVTSAR